MSTTTRSVRPAARSVLLLAALLCGCTLSACLPEPPPGPPSTEDTGVDSGPDPGTCEARRDCTAVK